MADNKVIEVTPSSLSDILDVMFNLKEITPFVWGGPGIGKSSIVKNLALKNNYNFVDIRLSMIDPVSLMGVLVPDVSKGTSNWLPSVFFSNEEPTLYFFDELNSAPPSIQAAAYQIILDRRIGPHSLKPNDFVIAAGNNFNDRGVTFKMPNPLANRFVHLNLRPSFDDFNVYALKKKLHHQVVGYLNYQRGDLYSMPVSTPDVKGFPTPRSWEFVSKILYKADEQRLTNDLLLPMIAGAVGEGVAYKFISFRKVSESINVMDIITGKIKELKPKSIDVTYALVTSMCYALNECCVDYKNGKLSKKKYEEYCDNFMGYFLNNQIQPEMVIMAVRMCLTVLDLDINVDLPNWDKFFRNETFSKPIREAFSGTDKKVKDYN